MFWGLTRDKIVLAQFKAICSKNISFSECPMFKKSLFRRSDVQKVLFVQRFYVQKVSWLEVPILWNAVKSLCENRVIWQPLPHTSFCETQWRHSVKTRLYENPLPYSTTGLYSQYKSSWRFFGLCHNYVEWFQMHTYIHLVTFFLIKCAILSGPDSKGSVECIIWHNNKR